MSALFGSGPGLGAVVLVPGITGSEIRRAFVPGWAGLVWCVPTTLLAGGFPAMRLPVPSEGIPGPSFPASAGGPPLTAYYGSLMGYLTLRGWYVWTPKADWRYPMAQDAAEVVALIRALRPAWPVRVVCHSRGGLLTRRALATLDAAGERGAVSRVVGLGVPHTGSLTAAAYVSGDSSETRLVRHLLDIFPSGLPSTYAVRSITNATRSWPALYELMPQPGCPWLDRATAAALYDPATWEPSATVPVAAYLSAALATWATTPAVPSWVEWYDVAGMGFYTPTEVPDLSRLASHGELAGTTEGDGTVPLASAAQSPRRRVVVPTGHSSLPIDPRVWEATHLLLRDGTPADVVIPGRPLSI